jgi:DNA-binding MarR family transcriptional regulator
MTTADPPIDPEQTVAPRDEVPLKLEEFLPYRLNVLASLVSQALSSIYVKRYRIGIPEWRVLVTLGQYGVMTGKAIGAHSHMHKTKVSRAVAILEHRKLLTRRANSADMREAFLTLTPAGRSMYEDLAPIALDFSRKLVATLDSAAHAAFEHAITELIERSAQLGIEIANDTSQQQPCREPARILQSWEKEMS